MSIELSGEKKNSVWKFMYQCRKLLYTNPVSKYIDLRLEYISSDCILNYSLFKKMCNFFLVFESIIHCVWRVFLTSEDKRVMHSHSRRTLNYALEISSCSLIYSPVFFKIYYKKEQLNEFLKLIWIMFH